jgi:dihydropteroate synthase
MGILNVTPDSFSDGGAAADVEGAVARARAMVVAGAAVLDVGGESTRPGAEPVSEAEELRRVVPVVRALVERVGVPVSVDTTKAGVFAAAVAAGASMLNDVSGLAADPEAGRLAARAEAAVVLMHRRGDARTMSAAAIYDDVVAEVAAELELAVARAHAAGLPDEALILDPGLGFAKTPAQSWRLVHGLEACRLGRYPLLVGPSRKSFLGAATGRTVPAERDVATAVVTAELARRGVECVRVHAVDAAHDAIAVAAALASGGAS